MVVAEITIRHQHLEFGIKRQECLEQILLSPKTKFLQNPIAPVIKRKENVVDVYDYARPETRQHFQEQIIDVSTNFYRMRAVDKQDVARAELRKEVEIEIFDLFLN